MPCFFLQNVKVFTSVPILKMARFLSHCRDIKATFFLQCRNIKVFSTSAAIENVAFISISSEIEIVAVLFISAEI